MALNLGGKFRKAQSIGRSICFIISFIHVTICNINIIFLFACNISHLCL